VQISVITVPYDSGHARRRMGRGPDALLSAGLAARLAAQGHSVDVHALELSAEFPAEPGAAFDLNRQIAAATNAASTRGAFPLVLSGNCISTVGAIAGMGTGDLGLLWFDAHGDFNTPESTRTGFLDGMALSVACGGCWTALSARIPGFRPLDPTHVVLAGARDFDAGERERFEAAGGRVVTVAAIESDGGRGALEALRGAASRLYVHLDLDVLDPSEGAANSYAVPGGLRRADVRGLLERARSTFAIAGLTISAYDPACDSNGSVAAAGLEFALACTPSDRPDRD
jgi:arginase